MEATSMKQQEHHASASLVMRWSSERVPLSSRSRQVNAAAALLPLSSRRALPSKWDDAERWISSPVFPTNHIHSFRSKRRSKSQSGPLGNSSPSMPFNYAPTAMAAHSPSLEVGGEIEQELECTRQWLILLNDPPPPHSESQDEISEDEGEAATHMGASSRRDMYTNTLDPEGSSTTTYSSPSPTRILCLPPPELPSYPPTISVGTPETVRDVKVDKEDSFRLTMPRKHIHNGGRSFSDSPNARIAGSDLAISTSRSQREEAKINAWENLQRANAEAAIRKLEMKLEKKRATTMDKILKKLERDELKAEKMRRSISKSNGSSHRLSGKASQRITELCRRVRMNSITNFLARTNY